MHIIVRHECIAINALYPHTLLHLNVRILVFPLIHAPAVKHFIWKSTKKKFRNCLKTNKWPCNMRNKRSIATFDSEFFSSIWGIDFATNFYVTTFHACFFIIAKLYPFAPVIGYDAGELTQIHNLYNLPLFCFVSHFMYYEKRLEPSKTNLSCIWSCFVLNLFPFFANDSWLQFNLIWIQLYTFSFSIFLIMHPYQLNGVLTWAKNLIDFT